MYRPNLTKYYLAVFLVALIVLSSSAQQERASFTGVSASVEQLLDSKALGFHEDPIESSFHTYNAVQGYDAAITADELRITSRLDTWYVSNRLISFGRQGSMSNTSAGILHPKTDRIHVLFPRLVVEYQHDNAGVRQNFIVEQRPSGHGNLQVSIRMESDLEGRLIGNDVFAWYRGQEQVFSYQDLRVWDSQGKALKAWMSIDSNAHNHDLALVVDDEQAVYPILIDPVSTVPSRLLQGTQSGSEYGISVASAGDVNGDGFSDVIVGASNGSNGQNGEGLAFVYHGSENGITPVPAATLEIDQALAEFGCSVSTAGDLNGDGFADVIVGARRWENSTNTFSEGAAFVFFGSATGIDASTSQLLERNVGNAFMGSNVACVGDVNNDGFSDIIVGSYLAARPTYQEGVAYVYQGSPTGAVYRHRLDGNHGGGHFSRSVSSAGDINGDGFSDIVIGASQYDNLGVNDGRVFIYYGNANMLGGGGQFPAPSLSLSGSGVDQSAFGWSVSCASDLNGDGYSDLAVGSYRDRNGQFDEGRIYVYHGSSTGLFPTPVRILECNQVGAWMGRSLSNIGDVNGDGYGDLAIGIPLFDAGQTDEGVVYIYLGSASGIGTIRDIVLQVNNSGANLGESVRSAGDVNGDGYTDIIVGAPYYGNTGAAAIFHGGAYNVSTTPSITELGTAAQDRLGAAVASAGDVNGDGFPDMLVSAPNASSGQANEGVVQVHISGLNGLSNTYSTLLEANVANGEFGRAIATAGDVNGDGYADILVGAPGIGNGRAYVYFGSTGGISAAPSITINNPGGGNNFGTSLASAGDVNSDGYADIIIGSSSAGRAFIYHGSTTGTVSSPSEVLTGTSSFGWDVSSAGDVNGDGYSDVAVSDPNNGNGIVRVYHGSITGVQVPHAIELVSAFSGAQHGFSISTAGDADGDGFSDLAVGAPGHTNGQANEGALHVYFGSASGLGTRQTRLEGQLANAGVGHAIDQAGDVNGDGYADLVVSAPTAGNTQASEGFVYVYQGNPNGMNLAGRRTLQSNITNARMGDAVGGLGDTDGDGFSDIIVGIPAFSGSLTEQGSFRIYEGNNANGLSRVTRQYQANLTDPLATNSMDFSDPNNFGIGHLAYNPTQRSDGRLHWEIAFQGQAWGGSPITNNVVGTDTSASWTDLGTTGVEIKELIFKQPGEIRYKWRVRVEYEMAKSFDGQRYSRWFYGYGSQQSDIGVLPVEMLAFSGEALQVSNRLEWQTASETDLGRYLVQRAHEGLEFTSLGSVDAIGSQQTTNYAFDDIDPQDGVAFYRLAIEHINGDLEYSEVIAIERTGSKITIYPNPANDVLNVTGLSNIDGLALSVLDASGRVLTSNISMRSSSIDISKLSAGYYTLLVQSATRSERLSFLKR